MKQTSPPDTLPVDHEDLALVPAATGAAAVLSWTVCPKWLRMIRHEAQRMTPLPCGSIPLDLDTLQLVVRVLAREGYLRIESPGS